MDFLEEVATDITYHLNKSKTSLDSDKLTITGERRVVNYRISVDLTLKTISLEVSNHTLFALSMHRVPILYILENYAERLGYELKTPRLRKTHDLGQRELDFKRTGIEIYEFEPRIQETYTPQKTSPNQLTFSFHHNME